jgi:hypothetical protein
MPFQAIDPRAASNVIQLKLREASQLFNSLDPSPFNEKDLDHDAEEFIVSWARELAHHEKLRLVIHFGRPLQDGQTEASIGEAVRHYFAYRASINRLDLRQLLKQGRTSLLIGGAFLTCCLLLGSALSHRQEPGPFLKIVEESLEIGGWVAMWRPMQIYLYDWWPLQRRSALLGKLSRMKIDVRWPAEGAPPAAGTPKPELG